MSGGPGLLALGDRALAEASNLVGYKNAQQDLLHLNLVGQGLPRIQPFATSVCKLNEQIIFKRA